jgi:hypothetical protein
VVTLLGTELEATQMLASSTSDAIMTDASRPKLPQCRTTMPYSANTPISTEEARAISCCIFVWAEIKLVVGPQPLCKCSHTLVPTSRNIPYNAGVVATAITAIVTSAGASTKQLECSCTWPEPPAWNPRPSCRRAILRVCHCGAPVPPRATHTTLPCEWNTPLATPQPAGGWADWDHCPLCEHTLPQM